MAMYMDRRRYERKAAIDVLATITHKTLLKIECWRGGGDKVEIVEAMREAFWGMRFTSFVGAVVSRIAAFVDEEEGGWERPLKEGV
jgi:hypothetical protein